MRYVNYVLKKHPIQPELFISDRRYLKELTTAVVLPAAIVGVAVVAGLLIAAGCIDLTRLVRLRRHQYLTLQRRRRYVRCVLLSLGRRADKHLVRLLMAA